MTPQAKFPKTAFPAAEVRAADLGYIVDALHQGYCCSVVGPSNTGKSLLLQSLLREEVRQRCAQAGARPPVMVFVDCLAAEPTEQAFYELVLRRIIDELEAAGESSAALKILEQGHDKVLNCSSDLAARSAFGNALRDLERRSAAYMVLILDEFDEVVSGLSHWAFRKYRVLTDELEGRLLSVVATASRLDHIRSDAGTSEFRELFDVHVRVLRPLGADDAGRLLDYLKEHREIVLGSDLARFAVELSGGHPGLLERIANSLVGMSIDPNTSQEALIGEVGEKDAVLKECQRLWAGLEHEDQAGLLILARGDEPPTQSRQRIGLSDKGLLLSGSRGRLKIFSPVFESFVKREMLRQREAGRRGIWYDERSSHIRSDELDITSDLTRDQYALLKLMAPSPEIVFSKDEIAAAVWPDESLNGITDDQIYQLVKRVKKKIGEDYIENVPGRGYRLKRPVAGASKGKE